jgi:hypothetical protein
MALPPPSPRQAACAATSTTERLCYQFHQCSTRLRCSLLLALMVSIRHSLTAVSIRHSLTAMWHRKYSLMQASIQLRAVSMDQWGHSIGRLARRRRNSISTNKVAEDVTRIWTARNDRTRALARLRISTGRAPTIYPPTKCFPGRRRKIRSCTIGTRCRAHRDRACID